MPIRYFVKLAYDGTAYHGWQIQDNALTVQEILEKKISIILKQVIELNGCGRTDAGVHALVYYAHFDIEKEIPDLKNIMYSINSILPHDIIVKNIQKVKYDYHSRFSAINRTYKYFINPNRNPFKICFEYHFAPYLDIELMNDACSILMKFRDFSCFSKFNTQVNNNLCIINEAIWEKNQDGIVFTITANRFLRNMVRAIVGTMIELGLKKRSIDDLKNIINNGKRSDAGTSVPAKGLFLFSIEYPEEMGIE
ncbi:MAG: tRNA pseudouridine(38-40) synthase TruA [Bacteroidota bacterium]